MNEVYRVFKSHDITSVILDPNLSLSAKGLFIYLYHLPNGATFSIKNYNGVDNESTVRDAVNELMERGYLERRELRDKNGRFVGLAYILLIPPTTIEVTDDQDYRRWESPTTVNTDDGNHRHRESPTSGNPSVGGSLDSQGIARLDTDSYSSFGQEKERKKEKEKEQEKEKVEQKEKEIEKEKERKKEKEGLTNISHDEKISRSVSQDILKELEAEHRIHRFANERVYNAFENSTGVEGLRGVEDTVVMLLQGIGFTRKSLRSKDDREQIEEIINKCDGDISEFLRKLRLLVEQKDIRLMEYGGQIDLKRLRERWDDLTLDVEIPDMRGWNLTKLAIYCLQHGYSNGKIVLLTKALLHQNNYQNKAAVYDIVKKVKDKMREISIELSKQKPTNSQVSNLLNDIIKRV